MAGRVPKVPGVVPGLQVPQVEDEATQRGLVALSDAVLKLQTARRRAGYTSDLAIGTNVIRHGLGRPLLGYVLTPTVASAAFAHALDVTNPHPESEVWITVIGAAQPGARIEVF